MSHRIELLKAEHAKEIETLTSDLLLAKKFHRLAVCERDSERLNWPTMRTCGLTLHAGKPMIPGTVLQRR